MTGPAQPLAILGGRPAFDEPLYVGQPNIPDHDLVLRRIGRVLESRRLTNDGPCVRELEERVADLLGVRHCVATANGTIALGLAACAAGLSSEVIVPSLTFVATPHALRWQGLAPVFADVDARTHNLDPDAVERLVTSRTSAILGVHLWGRSCDTERLEEIGARLGLRVLYDAAHAFGCSHRGRMLGGFGCAEAFSFHATKFFHTLEGGAVTTNDSDLAGQVRALRNFGFDGAERVTSVGINGKLNEVSAAVGLSLLDRLDELIEVNRRRYELYARELEHVPGVQLVRYDERERCNFQYVVLEVDDEAAMIDRDQLLEVLHAENVVARRYFYPGCHRLEPYSSSQPDVGTLLPQTEKLVRRTLCLPTGEAVRSEQVRTICEIVRLAASSRQIRARIRGATERRPVPDRDVAHLHGCSRQGRPLA